MLAIETIHKIRLSIRGDGKSITSGLERDLGISLGQNRMPMVGQFSMPIDIHGIAYGFQTTYSARALFFGNQGMNAFVRSLYSANPGSFFMSLSAGGMPEILSSR